jgi:anti-anti-sigma factor
MAAVTDDGASAVTLSISGEGTSEPVVAIAGHLDLLTVDEVRPTLLSVTPIGNEHLTIDLEALGFMDSSGIALLLEVAQNTAAVEIRRAPSIIRRVIVGTGVDKVLRLSDE